jgi:hypothetical protein
MLGCRRASLGELRVGDEAWVLDPLVLSPSAVAHDHVRVVGVRL